MRDPMMYGARALLLAVGAFALASCGNGGDNTAQPAPAAKEAPAKPTPSEAFLEMAAKHASLVLQQEPLFATGLGVSEEIGGEGYNARLGEYGPAANDHARELNDRFLTDLRGYDRAELKGAAAVTYDVLKVAYELGARRNAFDFGGASIYGGAPPYVITQISGPQLSIPRVMQTQQPIAGAADAEAYLARLAGVEDALKQTRNALSNDAYAGVTPPKFALQKIAASLRGFISTPPAQNSFVTVFARKLEAVPDIDAAARADFVARAEDLVKTSVYPGYTALAETVEELIPAASDDAGVWRLPDGPKYYQLALDGYGAEGRTADEIHELGLSEVKRITAEMDTILRAQGYTEGTVAQRYAALGKEERFTYPNTDEGRAQILADARADVDAVYAKAPQYFGVIPGAKVEVRRIPVYEQDSAPGGYYTAASLDGSRPGIYWINLKNTADWPKHTIKTLTFHEAVPGHHFQTATSRAIEGMPLIRNMMQFSEYGEGWALYAERLAAEMGMYENDPFGNLARLQSELFRAARLVTDTGIHAKKWSREQAIKYMVETTGDTEASLTREVERYSVWPGQACSYKLGELKIVELRALAEQELGDAFDLKAFHDAVLQDGRLPLPVLEANIKRWIAAQKAV